MRPRQFLLLTTALAICVSLPARGADHEMPWAFKAEAAEGYSIDLVSVEPKPGTPLVAGSSVEFKVTVSYSMTVANHGAIVLVFQDEENLGAKPDEPQVSQEVSGPEGTVSLADKVVVPTNAKELRLFIPLVPDGLSETSGEITLRYPITKSN